MTSLIKKFILGSPLEVLARRLYIRLDQSPGSRFDRLTLAIMRRCLRPNSNCIDIGAHRGTILAEILRLAPAGVHYAFEPIPQHCQYLARSFPTVRVYQLALSNTKQLAAFSHDLQRPTRSSFKQPLAADAPVEIITVQTETLDNIIPQSWPIQFIKADVEGAEFQVLQGAVNTLRAHRPVLIFEYTPLAQQSHGETPDAMYDLLTKDCRLHVSLMGDWLQHQPPLTRQAFSNKVTQATTFYFVAHP